MRSLCVGRWVRSREVAVFLVLPAVVVRFVAVLMVSEMVFVSVCR